jgi:hypothetical protein
VNEEVNARIVNRNKAGEIVYQGEMMPDEVMSFLKKE